MRVARTISQVAEEPQVGDVIDLRQDSEDATEITYRVLALVEEHVGYKKYGHGRFWMHKNSWRRMVENAITRNIVDLPEEQT